MSVVKLLDMQRFSKNLKEVTSTEIWITKGTYHPDGLFSEEIFGHVSTPQRTKTFGYINLNTQVIHPALTSILKRISRNFVNAIMRDGHYKINEEGDLVADKDGEIHGLTSVLDNLSKIKFRGGTEQREQLVKMLSYYLKGGRFFISKIPVMPPSFRDIVIDSQGSQNVDPINDRYKSIINLSLQLSSIPKGVVFDVLSASMQDLVLQLYDFISSKISKKEGLIRGDILGKRVDFSARAVVTGAGSELKSDEIGIPFGTAVKLFEPFVVYQLLNSKNSPKERLAEEFYNYNKSELSSSSLRNLISGIYKGDEIPPELESIIKTAVNYAIADKVVIAKRDPVLHSEGTMAFKPVLVEGKVLRLNPLYCSGYNADFDGDQMAIFTPMTNEAIKEAKDKMMTISSKDGLFKPATLIEKDTIAGLYALTRTPVPLPKSFPVLKDEKILSDFNIYDGITYNGVKTTVGRVVFNKRCLPAKYKFINEPINKKVFGKINDDIFKRYPESAFRKFCEESLRLGFKYYMIAPATFALEDLDIPLSIYKLKAKLKGADSQTAQLIMDQMEKELAEYLTKKGAGLSIVADSGTAKGGYGQLRQVLVCKGLIADIEGNVLAPVSASYADGLNSKEFFDVSPGTRKGIVDRVLNTATTGYLARQLIYATQSVEVDFRIKDCKTNRTLNIVATPDIAKRLSGRYVVDGKTYRLFNPSTDTDKLIHLRSPMYCTSKKICLTCYGQLALKNNSPYVGITAATIVGERGTQLIMRTFHTGGAVGMQKVNILNEMTEDMDKVSKQLFVKSFDQDERSLVSKVDGTIIIDKNVFLDPKNDINIENEDIILSYGYFNIKVGNVLFDISLDYETSITRRHGFEEDNESIIVPFKMNELIFTCRTSSTDFTQSVKVIQAVLSGRKAWKDGKHFLMKVFNHYVKLTGTDADFVHFETLCSNLLRDKSNPRIAARLNRRVYDPIVGNIKEIPMLESWLSSLEFEQFNKSVESALIYPRPEDPSILEKLLLGNL